jgi:hypothetical protein
MLPKWQKDVTLGLMNGITIKLESAQNDWLTRQAKSRHCSKALIVRDLIERQRSGKDGPSLHKRMQDLCGSLKGSKDLSVRKLKGYGRD